MNYDPLNWRYKLRIALSIFLPGMVVIIGVFSFFYYYKTREEKKLCEIHASTIVDKQKIKLAKEFEFVVADVLFFANYNQLLNMLDEPTKQMGQLIDDMYLFAKGSRVYDHIRILDSTGMEIIRINCKKEGPVVVAGDQLQSKGNRYYFKDSYSLKKDDIYVSPFDLNIEHGEIEQPLKPMLRFGTPIFDRQGQKKGILLFNYLGANLIKSFKDVVADSVGEYMLVNNQGFWFVGSDPEYEWGFMYENKKDITFGKAYPEAWKRISEYESGQFYTQEGLFTFETVYPLLNCWISNTDSGRPFKFSARMKDAKERHWKIISYIPQKILAKDTNKLLESQICTLSILTIIFGVSSWAMALAKARRKQSDELLKKVNDELEHKVKERTEELTQSTNNLLTEVTERKRTEEALKYKTKEMETLLRAVSHDLRSPLVNIEGFSGELAADCKQIAEILENVTADEKTKKQLETLTGTFIPESLNFIRTGTKKMDNLLKGLSHLAKIGTAKLDIQQLDINNLAQQVVDTMKFSAKEANATIELETLPDCLGDEVQINQVFSNLIGNAVKYLDPDRPGRIRIWGKVEGNISQYCVEDNGIGILDHHKSKVFEIFHRVDPESSVSGDGLGLTTTKQIVERHKGRIWLKSKQDKGSKFFVSLPHHSD